MEDIGKFLFLAAGAIALFSFLTVTHWVTTAATERRDRERLGLLKKIAEQPPEVAAALRELLREEDARVQQRIEQEAGTGRREGLQIGSVVMAVGIGLAIFLRAVVPDRGVWTLGITVILIGLVVFAFALFDKSKTPKPS